MRFTDAARLVAFIVAIDVGTTAAQNVGVLNSKSSPDDVKKATRPIVDSLLQIYSGNGTDSPFIPGLLPKQYFFFESGLMFDSLINYWAYSGDDSIVDTVNSGMSFQAGPNLLYMPANQTKSLGNDDQAAWALAAMTAAEHGFPAPKGLNASWLDLAKNVYDTQAPRYDTTTCGGGLRWQIYSINQGYDYKNSASQGSFVQLAARLARFTGNSTYLASATRDSQWMLDVGLAVKEPQPIIKDGTSTETNCSTANSLQWTNNAGLFANSFAYACNTTDNASCPQSIRDLGAIALAETTDVFQKQNILYEVACAPTNNCDTDQRVFRAYLARALANVRDMVTNGGYIETDISPASGQSNIGTIIDASARGAARQCYADGTNKAECGSDWSSAKPNSDRGAGEDISALEIILAQLPRKTLMTANSTASDAVGNGADRSTSPSSRPGVAAKDQNGTSGAVGLVPRAASTILFLVLGFIWL